MARLVKPIYSNYVYNGSTWQDWTREDADPFRSTETYFLNWNDPDILISKQTENGYRVYYVDPRKNSGQVRFEKWSVPGRKWLNFEITGYFKWMYDIPDSGYLCQLYGRGGHHSSCSSFGCGGTRRCEDGACYKAGLQYNSTGLFTVGRKEINHDGYCESFESRDSGNNIKYLVKGSPPSWKGRWYGLKHICWNYFSGSTLCVHNEVWVDRSSNGSLISSTQGYNLDLTKQTWVPHQIFNDRGLWAPPSSRFKECAYNVDGNVVKSSSQPNSPYRKSTGIGSIITKPGGNFDNDYWEQLPLGKHNLVSWRTDDIRFKIAALSAREIVAGPTRVSWSSGYSGTRRTYA